jgi:hypothetical protein
MKYAVFFLVVGVALSTIAVRGGGWSLLLLWPSVSVVLVGVAYAGLGPGVFGKRSDGTLHPGSACMLFPYVGSAWLVWHVARIVRREPPFHTLFEGVRIGRRLLPNEYPPGIASVVDLTCEFPEPTEVRADRTYYSLPVLDGAAPSIQALGDLINDFNRLPRDVYIHCAGGHGRTAIAAAALLISSERASGRRPRTSKCFKRDRRPE